MKKIIVATAIFVFCFSNLAYAAITFSSDVRVDDTGVSDTWQTEPAIAVDTNGQVYVVWRDYRNNVYGEIYFAKSTGNGASFGPNFPVENASLSRIVQWGPSIAIGPDGSIYVVWADVRNHGYGSIYFAKSIDGGNSFELSIRVDDAVLSKNDRFQPSIAVDAQGNIYIAWSDDRNGFGSNDIFFAKSTDGGVSFGPNIRADDTGTLPGTQGLPSIIVDLVGNIYIAWYDTRNGNPDIYFTKSTDSGVSFEPNVRIDDTGTLPSKQVGVSLAVDTSGCIYAAWSDLRNHTYRPNIYFAKSTNGGVSFETNVQVDYNGSRPNGEYPSMVVDSNGDIYIIWAGIYESGIYLAKSIDGGSSFEASIRVSDVSSGRRHDHPRAAIDANSNIYVAWVDWRNNYGNYDIYFSKGVKDAIPATLDINPDIINLKSKGQNITCYIELPVEHDVHDIDIYSVTIESNGSSVLAEILPADIGDFDSDGITDLMIKFDRQAVNGILTVGNIELTVKGSLIDGPNFEGSDTIKVIE